MKHSIYCLKACLALLLVLLPLIVSSQSGNGKPDPVCPLTAGNWKFIRDLSDEFNTRKIDTVKWYQYNPGWKGREPGYFSPANVKVRHGNLILTSKTETLKNIPPQYHTFTTAAVKSKKRMLYGYYEVRFQPMDSRASSVPDPKDKAGQFKIDYIRVWQQR